VQAEEDEDTIDEKTSRGRVFKDGGGAVWVLKSRIGHSGGAMDQQRVLMSLNVGDVERDERRGEEGEEEGEEGEDGGGGGAGRRCCRLGCDAVEPKAGDAKRAKRVPSAGLPPWARPRVLLSPLLWLYPCPESEPASILWHCAQHQRGRCPDTLASRRSVRHLEEVLVKSSSAASGSDCLQH
jgi:hypothetical protein